MEHGEQTIYLDGKMSSSLEWNQAREEALRVGETGGKICWYIDLGLFSQLKYPLSHQSQFMALSLSLDHFKKTLWTEFEEVTSRAVLYKGSVDFSLELESNGNHLENLRGWLEDSFADAPSFASATGISLQDFSEISVDLLKSSHMGSRLLSLYFRDAALEYLRLLTNGLPDAMPLYLELDGSGMQDPWLEALLLDRECYERLSYTLKNSSLKGFFDSSLTQMDLSETPQFLSPSVGICLPSLESYRACRGLDLEDALKKMIAKGIAYRIIPENYLITEWDGLDHLLVAPDALGPQGKRKLQGFCAAGGTVVNVGKAYANRPLGLAYEISLDEFIG